MADIEQQARELLAAEFERDGLTEQASALRRGAETPCPNRYMRAVAAALSATPPVPERLTIPMRPSGCGPNHNYVRGWNACIEHIQASCTTLATVRPPRDLRTKVRDVAEIWEEL